MLRVGPSESGRSLWQGGNLIPAAAQPEAARRGGLPGDWRRPAAAPALLGFNLSLPAAAPGLAATQAAASTQAKLAASVRRLPDSVKARGGDSATS